MSKAPAYQYYASDFDSATADWTNEEVGIYQRLLNYQWINGELPGDIDRLARIVRLSSKKFTKRWQIISKKFIFSDTKNFQNVRLEEERDKQRKYRESQTEKSKLGVKARQNQSTPGSTHGLTPWSTPGQPLQSSSSLSTIKDMLLYPLKNQKEYTLEAAKIQQYEKVYPNINVREELNKCRQWNIDNPGKRKTLRGITKHINLWLSSASEKKGYITTAIKQPHIDELRQDIKINPKHQERMAAINATLGRLKA